MGKDTRLLPTCGVFATMHSEFEAQHKLPDDLKALLRPVRPSQARFVPWCIQSVATTHIAH